jgi:hypothetical protein
MFFIFIGAAVVFAALLGFIAAYRAESEAHRIPFALDGHPVIANIVHSIDSTTRASSRTLRQFDLDGDEISIAPDAAALARQILADSSSYQYSISECFEPGMSLSFGAGRDQVDVIICLLCDRVVFYQGNQQIPRHLSEQGHERLVQLYQKIFGPNPPRI